MVKKREETEWLWIGKKVRKGKGGKGKERGEEKRQEGQEKEETGQVRRRAWRSEQRRTKES